MTTDFKNRDQLSRSAVRALGEEEADTLMATLPPMDWSEIATKSDLDQKLDELRLEVIATIESALRRQSQWVFGSVAVMALSMLGVVFGALALA